MKTGIHPDYVECKVHCSCGNEFTTRSTVPALRVELCSECHPFFTGKQKLVDTGGRVDRFNRRLAKKASAPAKGAKAAKAAKSGSAAETDSAEKATAEKATAEA